MAFTYTTPIAADRDRVRFLIGDTNSNRPLLNDDEIAHVLTLGADNIFRSAAYACDAIAAKLTREKSTSIQGITITRNLSAGEYKKLAQEYRDRSRSSLNKAFWMLKDPTEKTSYEGDTSLIPPSFARNQFDNDLADDPDAQRLKRDDC